MKTNVSFSRRQLGCVHVRDISFRIDNLVVDELGGRNGVSLYSHRRPCRGKEIVERRFSTDLGRARGGSGDFSIHTITLGYRDRFDPQEPCLRGLHHRFASMHVADINKKVCRAQVIK